MKRCWECGKYLYFNTSFSDPHIDGIYCSQCIQRALENHTIACEQCGHWFISYKIYTGFANLCPLCRINDARRERRIVSSNLKRAKKG